jgi:hypothetical protein
VNWGRIAAVGLAAALVVVLVVLVEGPWLRVRAVRYAGDGWTPRADLEAIMAPILDRNLLLVDASVLVAELDALPAVQAATVDLDLFGSARVTLVEGGAAAVWRTSAAALLVADDGTVVGVQARDVVPTGSLANLPVVDDGRDASHDLTTGDAIALTELEAALALAALPADRLGSPQSTLRVSLDATYGFVVSSPEAGWQAAFGFYGLDPADSEATLAARLESQAAALRTLFATHPQTGLAWIDVRNPGRVYFRARG